MKRNILTLMAGALMLGMSSMSAMAAGKTIAVSWKTFQEERWKTDEAAIKAVVEAAGNTYVSTDAQGSAQKQAADIEGLISQKPDVVLVVAFDSRCHPAVDQGAQRCWHQVDLPMTCSLKIQTRSISPFDNVGVGRIIAQRSPEGKAEGNYAFIKGDKGDPNATFLFQGMMEVLKEALDPARSRMSAKPSPTAGSRTMPRRTWSSA